MVQDGDERIMKGNYAIWRFVITWCWHCSESLQQIGDSPIMTSVTVPTPNHPSSPLFTMWYHCFDDQILMVHCNLPGFFFSHTIAFQLLNIHIIPCVSFFRHFFWVSRSSNLKNSKWALCCWLFFFFSFITIISFYYYRYYYSYDIFIYIS